MDYKLAVELRESGFPQTTQWFWVKVGFRVLQPFRKRLRLIIPSRKGKWKAPKTMVAAPTLSELIEACGDGMQGISKFAEARDEWGAYIFNEIMPVTVGKTPEEAVGRLYIALNKK